MSIGLVCSAAAQTSLLPTRTNLTVSVLQTAFTNAMAMSGDADSVRSALTNALGRAVRHAREREAFKSKLAEHRKAINSVSNQTAKVRREIEAGIGASTNEVDHLGLRELKSRLSQAEAAANAAKESRQSLEEEEKRRRTRRKEIPKLLAAASSELEQIKLDLLAEATEPEPAEVVRAKRLLLSTRQSLREQEIETLKTEVAAYDATEGLLALRTELNAGRAKAFAKRVAWLRARAAKAAQDEAEQTVDEAKQEEKQLRETFWKSFPQLSLIATNNTALADRLAELKKLISKETATLTTQEKELATLNQEFKTLNKRVQAFEEADVRINRQVGELLRDYRRNLSSVVKRGIIRQRLARITDASLRELEHREAARDHVDVGGRVSALMESFAENGLLARDGEEAEKNKKRISDRATKLLEATRQRHLDLEEANRDLGETLAELNSADLAFRKQTEKFRAYVDERVLWVRSSAFISTAEVLAELRTLGNLLHPANWLSLAPILWDGLVTEPFVCAFWLFMALLVLLAQPAARRGLRDASERARAQGNVALRPTWVAALCTLIVAAPVPVVFATVSVVLHNSGVGTPFSGALANGLMFSTTIYFTLGCFRHAVREPGLAADHFHWTEEDRRLIRRHLNWFLGVAVALTFVITFVEGDRSEISQGRLSFLLLAGSGLVFGFKLLHPTKGLSSTLFGVGSTAWRRLRFGLALLMVMSLAAASVIGYHFTALVLTWRLVDTIWLVLAVVCARAMMLRWFYLERKRIVIEKLEARKAEADDTVVLKKKTDQAISNISATEIKEQTRSLIGLIVLVSLTTGLWTIWSDITPALNILDRKALWHVEVPAESGLNATGENLLAAIPGASSLAPDSSTKASSETGSRSGNSRNTTRAVTVADVLFAVLVILVMVLAARNLPSLLEILILKHLRLETGGAYAVTTVVQYAVIGAGVLVACASIGLSWEKVKWLAAAVTLGIGFGLQEIFANYVAGVILLFERPVRVGDYITVDGNTGLVSRIRIRATTITNWEHQELVIPNKDLITGRLTNWTLSDTTNRVVFSVGVAYGSDTDKVEEAIKQVLSDNRYVLDDPKPQITFDEFADSALNFTIRAYIGNMDDRLRAIHSLHKEIDRSFREAEIEISFPQRDLHIRSGLEAVKS